MCTSQHDPVLDWWAEFYERPASLDAIETPEKQARPLALGGAPPGFEYFNDGSHWLGFYISTNFRHSGWQTFRTRIASALNRVYSNGPTLSRFCSCGTSMWILKSKNNPTEFKAVPDNCKSRWCRPCYGARTARVRARLAATLPEGPVRMVTLTLRASESKLTTCLNRLYGSFKLLRARPFWKNRVLGGVAFLEFKRGEASGLWHPHLHCLVQGRFLPQQELAGEWLAVTGDSHVVDVRLVKARSEVMRYVTKYCSKSNGLSDESSDDDLEEIIRSLKGRRTIVPFGTWRTLRLLHGESDEDWELVGHLNELLVKARGDDAYAAGVLQAYELCCDEKTGIFHLFDSADG
jgi:hypothetical protein